MSKYIMKWDIKSITLFLVLYFINLYYINKFIINQNFIQIYNKNIKNIIIINRLKF